MFAFQIIIKRYRDGSFGALIPNQTRVEGGDTDLIRVRSTVSSRKRGSLVFIEISQFAMTVRFYKDSLHTVGQYTLTVNYNIVHGEMKNLFRNGSRKDIIQKRGSRGFVMCFSASTFLNLNKILP